MSLINVDYTISAHVLAKRLRKVCNSIIGQDQSTAVLRKIVIKHFVIKNYPPPPPQKKRNPRSLYRQPSFTYLFTKECDKGKIKGNDTGYVMKARAFV